MRSHTDERPIAIGTSMDRGGRHGCLQSPIRETVDSGALGRKESPRLRNLRVYRHGMRVRRNSYCLRAGNEEAMAGHRGWGRDTLVFNLSVQGFPFSPAGYKVCKRRFQVDSLVVTSLSVAVGDSTSRIEKVKASGSRGTKYLLSLSPVLP